MTPTERSIALLKKSGHIVGKLERWNPYVPRPDGGMGIRQDLWGFADIIAFSPLSDWVVLVQTTSGSNAAKRVEKIAGITLALDWLKSPHRQIHVHAWAKRGERGQRKLWTCRTTILGLTLDGKLTSLPMPATEIEPEIQSQRATGAGRTVT
jgi:hypothetical protein